MIRFFYDITQKRWTRVSHFQDFQNRAVPPKTRCKKTGYPRRRPAGLPPTTKQISAKMMLMYDPQKIICPRDDLESGTGRTGGGHSQLSTSRSGHSRLQIISGTDDFLWIVHQHHFGGNLFGGRREAGGPAAGGYPVFLHLVFGGTALF